MHGSLSLIKCETEKGKSKTPGLRELRNRYNVVHVHGMQARVRASGEQNRHMPQFLSPASSGAC